MKAFFLLVAILIISQSNAQIIFKESFDSLSVGTDLTTLGYELSQNSSYTGNVTASVFDDEGNHVGRMVASPNGSAGMQMTKAINVAPQVIYSFEILSKGTFKRQLRVYTEDDELLASSEDYKPSTVEEETEWEKMSVSFLTDSNTSKIKIAFHHYWSGTIDLDSIVVKKIGEPGNQTSYYISSSSGDDNDSGSIDAPWKSLDKISSAFLFPGDSVLFKRGDRFDGHFVVTSSGSAEKPILIACYGEGALPIISGEVGEAGSGDYQEAILVENAEYLIFDGIEIQNERLITRSGVADTDAYGIYVKNTGTKVMHNLVFQNMVFKNVFAVQPMLDPDDFNSIQVSGLAFQCSKNTEIGKEKNIDGILVKNCFFGNLQRFGIQFKHSGGNEGVGNDSINRNMNIHIHNNEFSYNGGTGVLPNSTYNCLIENNIFDHPGASTDPRMPGRGSSIWNYKAINTIMQYNMCLSTRGYLDSHGIHIDNHNKNTFVQYNYMEDCEGGFVEILHGNTNAVYRFNVSVNDGWRVNENWEDSNHTIWVSSDRWNELNPTDGVYIYNNTCVINKPYTTSINMDGKNMFVYNNIWSSTNGAGMGEQNPKVRNQDTPFTMTNNLFEGTVSAEVISWDVDPVIDDAKFTGVGDNKEAYQLLPGSPAINSGTAISGPVVPGAGHGVFKDIPSFPNVDFYGNPIDLINGTPNIGACNTKEGIVGNHTIQKSTVEWLIYPQSKDSKIHFMRNTSTYGELLITLVNLNGQVIQQNRITLDQDEKEFDFNLNSILKNGIYMVNIKSNNTSQSHRFVWFK